MGWYEDSLLGSKAGRGPSGGGRCRRQHLLEWTVHEEREKRLAPSSPNALDSGREQLNKSAPWTVLKGLLL